MRTFWLHGDCDIKTKLLVHDSVIKSKLIYGLESAELTLVQKDRLDSFHKKGLRRILGWKTTFGQKLAGEAMTNKNDKLFETVKELCGKSILPMSEVYRMFKIRFFAKCYLADRNYPVRKAIFNDDFWITTYDRGKRKRAGPRLSWFYRTREEVWALGGSLVRFNEDSEHDSGRFYETCERTNENKAWIKEKACSIKDRLEVMV